MGKEDVRGVLFVFISCCFISLLADIISSVEFDHTGDYLATGDKGGRVVLFERNDGVNVSMWKVREMC